MTIECRQQIGGSRQLRTKPSAVHYTENTGRDGKAERPSGNAHSTAHQSPHFTDLIYKMETRLPFKHLIIYVYSTDSVHSTLHTHLHQPLPSRAYNLKSPSHVYTYRQTCQDQFGKEPINLPAQLFYISYDPRHKDVHTVQFYNPTLGYSRWSGILQYTL